MIDPLISLPSSALLPRAPLPDLSSSTSLASCSLIPFTCCSVIMALRPPEPMPSPLKTLPRVGHLSPSEIRSPMLTSPISA